MAQVNLSFQEIKALYDLGRYALMAARTSHAEEADDLKSALRKLAKAAPGALCVVCQSRVKVYSSGHCRRCKRADFQTRILA